VNGDGFSDFLIGAPDYSNGQSFEGRAYVYSGSASGPSATPSWIVESDQDGAQLGNSLAAAGDVNADGYGDVVVGASRYNPVWSDGGRVLLFLGSSGGLATSPAWFTQGSQHFALVGWSVASAGDVNGDGRSDVLVGALTHDDGESGEGCAYVYLGTGAGLTTTPAWSVQGEQVGARLGSVSPAGDANGDGFGDVVVGAYSYDDQVTNGGRVELYLGASAGLATTPAWSRAGAQSDAAFGLTLAAAGDVNGDGYADVLAGAPLFDGGSVDEGRVEAYLGGAEGLTEAAGWSATGVQAGARFGSSASTVGDLDGDGFDDFAIGAPLHDNGETNEGAVFVYSGSGAGPAVTPNWTLEANVGGAQFGVAVAGAGDVNGDGFGDLLVGANLFADGQTAEGRAYVYLGSASGLSGAPAWGFESDVASAQLGGAVAGAGDLDGDGYSDVVIGASQLTNGQSREGRAYVFHGSAAGLAASPTWTLEGEQIDAFLGVSVAGAGDVNGDGFADLVLGSHQYDVNLSNEGRVLVFHGSRAGLAASPSWVEPGGLANASFGIAVATAGDVNGDGFADVLVGANTWANALSVEGAAFLFLGSAAGLAASAAWSVEGEQVGAVLGSSVAAAGDVDGDGYGDVLVGAPGFDAGESNEGRVYAYLGSATGLSSSPAWTIESDEVGAQLGFEVASVGDVNGDGFSDVIAGSLLGGASDEGSATLHYGNAGHGGLLRTLRQRTRSGNRPIAVVGSCGENGLFRLRCEFPDNAATVGWIRSDEPEAWLEWEVKPLGVPFDGAGLRAGTPQTLPSTGGVLSFDEHTSIDDALPHARSVEAHSYRWRARVATNSALFPHSAWFSVSGSTITEAKLRKPRRVGP
jgi:hypothetical protein